MKIRLLLYILILLPKAHFGQTPAKDLLNKSWRLISGQNRETAFAADSLVFVVDLHNLTNDTLLLKPLFVISPKSCDVSDFSFSFKLIHNENGGTSLYDTQYGFIFTRAQSSKVVIALTPPPDFCKDPHNPDIIAKMKYKIKTLNNTRLVLQKN